MTQDDGHLHDFNEKSDREWLQEMKRDNLTLVDIKKLTDNEKEIGVVASDRKELVDRLKHKSRWVRRVALKQAIKLLRREG